MVCHASVKRVLKTDQTLYLYTASGHGSWEAALANLFSPGDTVLIVETGCGVLETGHGKTPVAAGDTWVVPFSASSIALTGTLRCLVCLPPS